MGIIIIITMPRCTEGGVNLKCIGCGHCWTYVGTMSNTCNCPDCGKRNNIKEAKKLREDSPMIFDE